MKREYYRISDNSIRIIFPKHLTRDVLEEILLQCYSKTTLNNNYINITFSFQALEWIDIFEISLLSLWIHKSKTKQKKLSFVYPLNNIINGFLLNLKFINFTEQISTNQPFSLDYLGQEDSGTIFYPLTFLDNSEFLSLLDDLNYKERLKQVFKEIADIELIKSGKLRDIILTELGENMYVHGGGVNANIIATSYKQIDPNKVSNRIGLVSIFEKNFFTILGNKPYIQIVISDNGKGIYNKLIDTYRKDITYAKYKKEPSHADLIEYAFLPYTSSRNLSERLNFIDNLLDTDTETNNNPPVTGLNKLKLIIKEYRGLLLIKSGKGIICYDYLTDADLIFPTTNDDYKKYKNLASFNGVQYKILIPFDKPKSILPIKTKFYFQETEKTINYIYKRLDDYFDAQSKYKVEVARKQYIHFEKEIESYHIANGSKNNILIFDLCEAKVVNQKILHLIILKLSKLQTNSQINSFINLPSEYIELLDYKFVNSKPIVGFDNNFQRVILGIEKKDSIIFQGIISQSEVDSNQINDFFMRYPFLFDLTTKSFIHNRNQILSYSNQCIREKIKEIILNPENLIFHPEVKVLIPTNLYCKGYFEIGNLFKNTTYRYLVHQWLKIGFNILRPDVIISLNEHCGNIIFELKINYNKDIDSIILKTPIEEFSLLDLRLKVNKSSKIIIFTDVISSSKTITRILNVLSTFNVIHILTVVNATHFSSYKLSDRNIPVSQSVHYQISYYENLPDDWLYSELQLTDPNTNFLIYQDEYRAEDSLLKKFSIKIDSINGNEILCNKFLEEIVIPYNLAEEGHFITKNKHFSYLFNIVGLVNKFEHIIVDSIVSHYLSEINKLRIKGEVDNYILHFSYNPGLLSLCSSISKQLKRSEIIAIDFSKEINPLSQDIRNENVIIIDDAFITGGSVTDLIDYCELKGAKNIFVYILIKRSTSLSARKLEKIKKYGHSRISVRYLFDSELPNFSLYSCPICKEKNNLKKIEQVIGIDHIDFWNYINFTHGNKNERIVNSDFNFSNIPKDGNNISLRWKVETSKQELISQKEIIQKLENFKSNLRDVKSLYSIYSFEKENLLNSELYSNNVYFVELKNRLIEKGKEIILEQEERDISFLNHIFDVIFWLDVEVINNIFKDIVKKAFTDDNSAYELIFIVFKNIEKCPFSLNKFSSVIKNRLDLEHNLKISTKNTLIHFTEVLDSYFNNTIIYVDEKRTAIRTLFLENYHEFPRLYETLQSKLKVNSDDTNEITNLWNSLRDIMNKSIKNLKLVQETGISREQIEKLDSKILELNDLIIKTENLIKLGQNPAEFQILPNISELIVGKKGIKEILLHLRIDLKNVIDFIVLKNKNKFESENIVIYCNKPDYPCIVYGESSQIISSIDNIFENTLKHSHASKFVLSYELTDDNQYIEINFYDNGIGIDNGGKISKGVGLNNVTENIKKYLGQFIIDSNYQDNEFNTHLKIQLINLVKMF